MRITFKLPHGAGGMAAQFTHQRIRKRLIEWANQHGEPNYTFKTGPAYTSVLEFEQDEHYTLFALTWQHKNPWIGQYRLEH